MRLGVMIGAERGDMARKVAKLVSDIEWAEAAGLDTAWMPQGPDDFDCLTMVALMAGHTSRIDLGTAGGARATWRTPRSPCTTRPRWAPRRRCRCWWRHSGR